MFKNVPPEKLAATVIEELISETAINPHEIDEVILGNAIGPGGNMARLSLLTAGLPLEIPGVTIDRQCGSGLEAINMACRFVQAGAGEIYIAGGVESSSLAPWKIEKPTSLYTTPNFFSRAAFSPEQSGDPSVGGAAANVAEAYHISREAQDVFAYESHQKAVKAQEEGLFEDEIVAIGTRRQDEGPRKKLSMKTLQRMPAIFTEKGSVTAGNACAINDGASAVLVMSEQKCQQLGLKPILRFIDATSAGVDPNLLGIGPIPAIEKLLKRTGKTIDDIDLIEFNEAFASQVLATVEAVGIPQERLNVNGGALAFGHPYGASGAILVTRLCTEMARR